jgi:formylglycine-generating enzyme
MGIHKLLVFVLVSSLSLVASAGAVDIEFVPVGNVRNAADITGFGAVDHEYQIGKYEVTAGQYTEFLNAVATSSDPYGLYNPNMATTQYGSKIVSSEGVYTALQPKMPVNYVSWGDAVRFCNWLSNGQPVGVEDDSTTETGAYMLKGKNTAAALMTVTRNADALYFLPSYDEWYKAAYYDPNKTGLGVAGYWEYPTRNDNRPSNVLSSMGTNNANYVNGGYTLNPPNTTDVGSFTSSPSSYSTFDQGGNIMEWVETPVEISRRAVLGGSFGGGAPDLWASDRSSNNTDPTWEIYEKGFRIATVPEPSSFMMISLIGITILFCWRGRQLRD